MEVREIPADSPDALALVQTMFSAVEAQYGRALGPGPTATPEEMSPPGGAYVAIYDGDRPIAGGGIKRLSADAAEIKRMYVDPHYRGRGISRLLLAAIEDAARGRGYTRVRLDTGIHQQAALHLYRTAGYSEIPDYNDNPYASYWGEKILEP